MIGLSLAVLAAGGNLLGNSNVESVSVAQPNALSQSLPSGSSAFHDKAGYLGNHTVYLNTGVQASASFDNGFGFILPPIYSAYNTTGQPSSYDVNALAVGFGGNVPATDAGDYPFSYSYTGNPSSGHMTVDLPVSTAGFSNYTANSTVSGAQYGGVQALTLSLAVPDLTGTAGSILAEYNSGFNVTGSYNLGTTMSDMINATVDYLLGQLPDGLGTSASTISYLMSTMADHKVVKPLSNSSASVEFGVVALNTARSIIATGQCTVWCYCLYRVLVTRLCKEPGLARAVSSFIIVGNCAATRTQLCEDNALIRRRTVVLGDSSSEEPRSDYRD